MLMTTLGFCAFVPYIVPRNTADGFLNVLHSGDYTPGADNRFATMSVADELS